MARKKRTNANEFLATYDVEEDFLIQPEATTGRPGMIRARSDDGRDVVVKLWRRRRQGNDGDIEEIWRSEIRQLQRLAAVPRADDLLVPLAASGSDRRGFYLILDAMGGDLLEVYRSAAKHPQILSQIASPRTKRVVWGNILRLAQALELLHSQGIIHRNIDPWSVVTSLSEEPDFKLTGFEWSMRIATMGSKVHKLAKHLRETNSASFGNDWRDLGFLASQLIGAEPGTVANLRVTAGEIADHISASEGSVLRAMYGLDQAELLDGALICTRIQDILSELKAQVAGREAKLCLALRFGIGSNLSEAVRRASSNEIETADVASQLEFVKMDLSGTPFVVRTEEPGHVTATYVLVGRLLTYSLGAYRSPGSTSDPDWEFAECNRARYGRPIGVVSQEAVNPASIDPLPVTEAHKSFPRRRGRVEPWSAILGKLQERIEEKSETELKHQAFALLSVLEMAYSAANVFPVTVHTPRPNDEEEKGTLLRVSARLDPGRTALSKALSLEPPATRLLKALEADDVEGDNGWVLSELGALGDRGDTSDWRFVEAKLEGDRQVLTFDGQIPTGIRGLAYIFPSALKGEIAQFRRRSKALRALREHTELLRMLVDARIRVEDAQDPLKEDAQFSDMDSSKQAALSEILSTIPLFLLQGPPGVGKTYVVGDLVRRRLEDEPTTRILLTAQSNAAVDHLMKDVQKAVQGQAEPPVMIRARPAEDEGSDTALEIDRQANRLLRKLSESALLRSADQSLARRVRKLVAFNRSRTAKSVRRGPEAAEARAFEAMILRAANLVFATTNSAAVERLIDERTLFDWTMVEEAGKATGGELVSPLLLSHRRLMIGDHKQLPPYGSDKMSKLLTKPEQVRSAIAAAEDYISRYLREQGTDEVFEEVNSDKVDYGRVCSDATRVLTLFEDLLETEFRRNPSRSKGKPIARRLNEQYRMHPAIAKMVSDCFYDGSLITNDEKRKLYLNDAPPFRFKPRSGLPEAPIVFINLPYVRGEVLYRGGDRPPAWHNPDEATALLRTLSTLEAAENETPTLAILSPYREQVKRLKSAIDGKLANALRNLKSFEPAVGGDEFCGTVDSFQGDQADLVLVSLVRNNGHATPAKALGFLRDDRRMNVLLSRAKWRMVIVGSLTFYEQVLSFSKALPDADIGFLKRFIDALRNAEKAGFAKIVDWSAVARTS